MDREGVEVSGHRSVGIDVTGERRRRGDEGRNGWRSDREEVVCVCVSVVSHSKVRHWT